MIKQPSSLKPGDTIGIVCPAGYMPVEKIQASVQALNEWGYKVKIGPTVGGRGLNYFSGTDEERANDLQQMLDDKSIKAILFGRGGYGTGRIIDQLNFKKFKKDPKWIIGYSDITVLHSHLYSNFKISSLHAPMSGAFNDGGDKNEFIASLRSALEGKIANYKTSSHPFNRTGEAIGELLGGNLSLLAHLCGTNSDIKTNGRILFLEDIGEYVYNVDRMMYQLKRNGKLSKLAGLIIGGFTDIKDTERPFGQTAFEVIRDIIAEYDYPVCFDFPVSHTDRNYAMKIGASHLLKVTKKAVALVEN